MHVSGELFLYYYFRKMVINNIAEFDILIVPSKVLMTALLVASSGFEHRP
jgi:hypothetical protein